jgi:hypothetical protein
MTQPQQQPQSQQQYYNPPSQAPIQQQQPSYQPYQPVYQEYKNPVVQQQEYRPIFDRKKPEPIDFSEKIEDGVITNMDDLIQKHMREREQELKMVAASQQQMVQPVSGGVQESNEKVIENIKIIEQDSNVLPLSPSSPQREIIKPDTGIDFLKEQVLELKDIILLLKQDIKEIREKMEQKLETF